jgi:hypothetical protein
MVDASSARLITASIAPLGVVDEGERDRSPVSA